MSKSSNLNTIMPNTAFYKSLHEVKKSVKNTEETKIMLPKQVSKLYLHTDLIYVFGMKKPNVWWRFWQYILLGWRWEDYK